MVGSSNTPAKVLARLPAEVPLDPLQRRNELIAHYDRHGYPDRARYQERAHLGPDLVKRALAGDFSAVGPLLEWWTGTPPADIFAQFMQLARLEHAVQKAVGRQEKIEGQLGSARQRLLAATDEALAAGLAARIGIRLLPLGARIPTADSTVHEFILRARGAAGGRPPALIRVQLPPPHHDGIQSAFIVVCERCSLVDLAIRQRANCRFCAKRHPRPEGSLAFPTLDEPSSFLVTGESSAHVLSCEVCGDQFISPRIHARTCSDACRVAKSRAER